jgi:tetratricopeptide (TPR) repeat protein
VPALYDLGRTHLTMNREQDAIQTFEHLLQVNPDHLATHRAMAQLLLDKEPEKALVHLQAIRRLAPDDPQAPLLQVEAYKNLARTDEAERLLKQLITANPKNIRALVGRALLLIEQSRSDRAEGFLRTALTYDHLDPTANDLLYQALLQQGKVKEAREAKAHLDQLRADLQRLSEIAQATRYSPQAELLHEAGLIYLRHNQAKRAIDWLTSSLQVKPDYAPAHKALAEAYQRVGDPERAAYHRQWLSKVNGKD